MSPDETHLFTVSLDHTLKAWNMRTGKTAVQTDLLGENNKENNHPSSQFLINPSQGSLMEIVNVEGRPDGDLYYVVTNSPKDHQFKFWGIRDADSVAHGLRDLQSDVKFIPPLDELMNTNVWQLIQFHIKPGHGWRDTQLWIRVRAGTAVKLFTLTFDLLATPAELEDVWQNNWAAVDEGSVTIDSLLNHPQYPADTSIFDNEPSTTELWLDFLFYPGRFTTATLESALFIYKTGLKLLSKSSRDTAKEALKERMCEAISAKVVLELDASGQAMFERYQLDVAAQWRTYFGLVRLLHTRRSDSLSLAFDAELNLPWSVRADFVSPIRTCCDIETIQFNEEIFTTQEQAYIENSIPLANFLPRENPASLAKLLIGARMFRQGLSIHFQSAFDQAFTKDALRYFKSETPNGTANGTANRYNKAIERLYNACSMHSEVTDEDYNTITDFMQDLGGLGELKNDDFYAAIDCLGEEMRGTRMDQALTRYGDKATIRGAQETLERTHDIILDLLALVLFMAGDLEPEELSAEFNASDLFEQLINKLKEQKTLLWLASNVRQEPARRPAEATTLFATTRAVQPVMTVFESIFIGDWESVTLPNEDYPSLLTYWSRAWTYGPNLTTKYSGLVLHVFSNLIMHDNIDLAADFERFLPPSSWSHYLRGRLYLAMGDYAHAGARFRFAAEDLSSKGGLKMEELDTSHLLKANEKVLMREGPARYYLHISNLYEALKIHTFAADFASIALRELSQSRADFDEDALSRLDTKKQSAHASPAAMKIDLTMEEIRLVKIQSLKQDILKRMFSTFVETRDYKHAFNALLMISDPTM